MIWVYAICDRAAGASLDDAGPLEVVAEGELVAVTSREVEPPAVWDHEQTVERLMECGAVLPMRFGSTLADDGALREALNARRDDLLGALDAVRGRVELAVRAIRADVVPEAAQRAAGNGRTYLRARLARRDCDDATATALHEPLAAVAVAARRDVPRPPELLRASYLVERAGVPRFGQVAQRLQREHPEAAVVCTGPWPPYSFVEVDV